MFEGCATIAATQAHAAQHGDLTFNQLGSTGILVSQVGYGTHHVNASEADHRVSLTKALMEGINLIDTSGSYSSGESETLIGSVLSTLFQNGNITRGEVFVMSKIGHIQDQDYLISLKREQENRPYPEVVHLSSGFQYCIHPEFLDEQITKSLNRLQLSTLDCLLLHNPENYLYWAKMNKHKKQDAQSEIYNRLKLAFSYLEREVKNGRIGCYGVSSNCLCINAKEYEFISIESLCKIAESVSASHHLKVIQFPFNLFENKAITDQNHQDGASIIEFAQRTGMGVIAHRPFDTVIDNSMTRLVDIRLPNNSNIVQSNDLVPQILESIEEVADIEDYLVSEVLSMLALDKAKRREVKQRLSIGVLMVKYWKKLGSSVGVNSFQESIINRALRSIREKIQESSPDQKFTSNWIGKYERSIEQTIDLLRLYYLPLDYNRSRAIRRKLNGVAGLELEKRKSLSQAIIHLIRSTYGIDSILVGMRKNEYVSDVLTELKTLNHQVLQPEDWRVLNVELAPVVQELIQN